MIRQIRIGEKRIGQDRKTYNTNESQDEVDELIKGKLSEKKEQDRTGKQGSGHGSKEQNRIEQEMMGQ